MFEKLLHQLKRDEGLRLKPYQDTRGILTIGYGRNLEQVGISHEEAQTMLENDALKAYQAARLLVRNFESLSENRQLVIINMVFNLGAQGFKRFRKLIQAIEANDFKKAVLEMRDSQWYEQVPNRAQRLIQLMGSG